MSRMQERTKESQGNHFPEALSDYWSKLDSPKQEYGKQLKPPTIPKPGGDCCSYFNVFIYIHRQMYLCAYTYIPRQDIVNALYGLPNCRSCGSNLNQSCVGLCTQHGERGRDRKKYLLGGRVKTQLYLPKQSDSAYFFPRVIFHLTVRHARS